MSSSNALNDPRDSSRETRLTLPKSWKAESVGKFLHVVPIVSQGRVEDSGFTTYRRNGLDGYVLSWDGDGIKE